MLKKGRTICEKHFNTSLLMNAQQLLNEILPILSTVREDKKKLEKIHKFLMDEIYEKPEKTVIPKKYKPITAKAADNLSAGEVCFINTDTLEIESVSETILNDPDEFEAMTGETVDSLGLKYDEWENCLRIDPLESRESFRIMEGFADNVSDKNFQQKLINSLNRNRPFANFKWLIDNSDYRQDGFDYRQAWLEQYVYELMENELNKK